ncbi:MAG: hypothetical protein AAGF85_03525 [Bacteroidota bacterium]
MIEVEKFRGYMVSYNLNEEKIAKITGHPANVVREMLEPGKALPKWLKLVMQVWEKTEARQQQIAI